MTNPKDVSEMLKNFANQIEQQFQAPAIQSALTLKQALVEIKGIDRKTELRIEIDNEHNTVQFEIRDKRTWDMIASGNTLEAVVAKLRDLRLPGMTPEALAAQMSELEVGAF